VSTDARAGLARGLVLVVEDEPAIADVIRLNLAKAGYGVHVEHHGDNALDAVHRLKPAAIILDVGLPGMDGFEVCRIIRARSTLPIIMLTARDEEADRVAGLEVGADDYVPKPFSPRELVARVKAILRRAEPTTQQEVLHLGDVILRRSSREVEVAGQPVELTVKEFDLLAFFMENPGAVLSREVLLDRVWGMAYPGETRTVDVHVGQLRKKLGRPQLIRTVRGAGYKAHRG
jgi:two-component system, OmpR family, response regulator MtrA